MQDLAPHAAVAAQAAQDGLAHQVLQVAAAGVVGDDRHLDLADPHGAAHQRQQVDALDDDLASVLTRGEVEAVVGAGPFEALGGDQRDLVGGIVPVVVRRSCDHP